MLGLSFTDGKLHPSAFFSCRLSPAETKYDMGDGEFLSIKLALEEWMYWLKGAEQTFIIWTDYKNLAYLQNAKLLNAHQARWSPFFTRFNFSITYDPNS